MWCRQKTSTALNPDTSIMVMLWKSGLTIKKLLAWTTTSNKINQFCTEQWSLVCQNYHHQVACATAVPVPICYLKLDPNSNWLGHFPLTSPWLFQSPNSNQFCDFGFHHFPFFLQLCQIFSNLPPPSQKTIKVSCVFLFSSATLLIFAIVVPFHMWAMTLSL